MPCLCVLNDYPMRVIIVPPDPNWSLAFADEAQRIRVALHALDLDVEHIGSTAIAGVFAKPVIDMLLAVDRIDLLDDHVGAMHGLGYEVKGEFGIPGRRYFRKDSASGVRTHQVHAFERGSDGERRHLAFRDYMNAHSEAARSYSALKQRLVHAFGDDARAYIEGKDAFVKQHEALALQWIAGESIGAAVADRAAKQMPMQGVRESFDDSRAQ